jgi:hypothetical protein
MDKYADVRVQFTREEWFVVGRDLPPKPWGSWQNNLAEVQRRTNRETLQATLPATLIVKCEELAEENMVQSRGTWQTCYRTVVGAVRRARADHNNGIVMPLESRR